MDQPRTADRGQQWKRLSLSDAAHAASGRDEITLGVWATIDGAFRCLHACLMLYVHVLPPVSTSADHSVDTLIIWAV